MSRLTVKIDLLIIIIAIIIFVIKMIIIMMAIIREREKMENKNNIKDRRIISSFYNLSRVNNPPF